jgi:hypothetical protein
MERHEVLQSVIDLFGEARYLEIGVSAGVTFRAVKAKEKYAVDPYFLFDIPSDAELRGERYFSLLSDEFFEIRRARTVRCYLHRWSSHL